MSPQIAHLGMGASGSVQLIENKLADQASRRAGTHICAAKVLYAGSEVNTAAVIKHRYDATMLQCVQDIDFMYMMHAAYPHLYAVLRLLGRLHQL